MDTVFIDRMGCCEKQSVGMTATTELFSASCWTREASISCDAGVLGNSRIDRAEIKDGGVRNCN
jgi:hypothetical protein